MNITLELTNLNAENYKVKLQKAVHAVSSRLGVKHTHKGEAFAYKANEQLVYKWYDVCSKVVNDSYLFTITYFGLPEVRTIAKAHVTYNGKVLYSPENGQPIKKGEWNTFVEKLEKYVNKNKVGTEKLILNARTMGKILERMSKQQSLDTIKIANKPFDWVCESVKNMNNTLKLTDIELARIEVATQSAAERVTGITNKIKTDIKQIIIDGVKNRYSKSVISQNLYDKMTVNNRDFQKLADTEIQNNLNSAYLLNETAGAEADIYFQRIEVIDDNTCQFCKKINGMIAKWSNVPLASDKIQDDYARIAIWDGKEWNGKNEVVTSGVAHPFCRGIWVRYNPMIKKSLTWSGYKLADKYIFAGLHISVENKKGSVRSGIDKDGHEWHCKMYFDYGYICGTEGVDGDHVDVYIGQNEESKDVYIVHQNDPVTRTYDEDKVMLGFASLHDAKEAYVKQYDRDGFLGSITIMPVKEFREKVVRKDYHGKMIKSIEQSNKAPYSFSEKIKRIVGQ